MGLIDIFKLGLNWRIQKAEPGDKIPESFTLPDQTGQAGKVLKTNGANTSWQPGGGGTLSLEVDGVPNVDQTLLNLISGTNISLTDDGSGGVTIDSTGGVSGYTIILVSTTPYAIIPVTGIVIYLVDTTIGNITIN